VGAMASTPPRLSDDELQKGLAELSDWSVRDGKLQRSYRFADFGSAMAFMVRVAFEAERLDHHPNWSNVYDRVEVTLWTHDADGLTERDLALAEAMETHAGAASSSS